MDARSESRSSTWPWPSLLAAAGVVVCALVAMREPDMLWRAYLLAFLTSWLVTVGAMGLLAIGNLTGGRWAQAARPYYLSTAALLPLVAILFVPIGLGLDRIYPWADPSAAAAFHFPPGKAAYLEPVFFLYRAAGYFVAWLVVGWLLVRVSRLDAPPATTPGMRRVGALSLVLLAPTTMFAAFDWAMTLEPEWYSSIYGALLTAGGVLAAHALAVVGVASSRGGEPDHERAVSVLGDMGNLLLALLMVWTYFALSQFLLIWSANLPSEITWYLRRLEGGWQVLAVAIALLHFVVPFLLLLSRDVKRVPARVAAVAGWIVAMYAAHVYWTIVPAFDEQGVLWQAANVGALAAVGGLWLALYRRQVNRTTGLRR